MFYTHDSLSPENQEKLIISVAPYGPEWVPGDFPEDIPVSMDEQVQKAVDCYNAGATVLHVHVREADGRGSKRLSMFDELLQRLRDAVPKMILQVGGSISFAPEPGGPAQWPGDDSRHALALLKAKPDQVTIAINSSQMNMTELMTARDVQGTSLADPGMCAAFREMFLEAGPSFVQTNLRLLCENGIQPFFMLGHAAQLETLEHVVRNGQYQGPLNIGYVAIGGGAAGRHPADLVEFARRVPDGATLTNESLMRSVFPTNAMAIAMGHHVRVGIEDTLWGARHEKMTSVQQVEWCVQQAKHLGRDIASADEARATLKIGTTYASTDETLKALGWAPNRKPGQRGQLLWN